MTYQDLEQRVALFTTQEITLLRQAYSIAHQAHLGQKRLSGEDYIEHPLAVACILADMHMDCETIVAGLLHDVVEDTTFTIQDIEKLFGKNIAHLVDGVSKLDKIEFKSSLEIQAENFRKMLLAMSRDIRVIVIKLIDRLHNMRTIGVMSLKKQFRKSQETVDIYAPIARRLGMSQISDELEDLGLRTMYPLRYLVIEKHLQHVRDRHQAWLNDIKTHILTRLKQHNVDTIWVNVREKQVYSVYKKMREKKCSFNEVTDVYGIRVCVGSTDDCYRALGIMHLTYRPFPSRMKDYIASPKPNGYQSLHTVLMGPGGLPVEIQIRTAVMHQMAEQGISAHWLYKTGLNAGGDDVYNQQWIQNLLEIQSTEENSLEFIENIKTDLFAKSVYVFTPLGKIIELKKNATVLDFAFEISLDLGLHAHSARIDHELCSLSTALRSGQTVHIMTNLETQVNASWLEIVHTNKAKQAINKYLKDQQNKQFIRLGEQIILQHVACALTYDDIFTKPLLLHTLAQHFHCKHYEEVLMALAHGTLPVQEVCYFLCEQLDKQPVLQDISQLMITGKEGDAIHYATCCMPIAYDSIQGVFESETGLVIHRTACPYLISAKQKQEPIDMSWKENVEGEYQMQIVLKVINQRGVLGLIAIAIADAKANINNIHIVSPILEYAEVIVTLSVSGLKHYNIVSRMLKQLRQVITLKRVGDDVAH